MTEPRQQRRPSILDLLDLEYVEENLYRSCAVSGEQSRLFGGQVAAQALYAAGRTVDGGRLPHSLHGYFLRQGSTIRPTHEGIWASVDQDLGSLIPHLTHERPKIMERAPRARLQYADEADITDWIPLGVDAAIGASRPQAAPQRESGSQPGAGGPARSNPAHWVTGSLG